MEELNFELPSEVTDEFRKNAQEVTYLEDVNGVWFFHHYVTEKRFIEIATSAGHSHTLATKAVNWLLKMEKA